MKRKNLQATTSALETVKRHRDKKRFALGSKWLLAVFGFVAAVALCLLVALCAERLFGIPFVAAAGIAMVVAGVVGLAVVSVVSRKGGSNGEEPRL